MPPNVRYCSEEEIQFLPPYFKNTGDTPEPVLCRTEGRWPEWLSGTFVRTAGGFWSVPLSEDGSKPDAQLQHFFDGLNVLHKFEFVGGKVTYQSRSTADGVIQKAKKSGFLHTLIFGLNPNTALRDAQDPCWARLGSQASIRAAAFTSIILTRELIVGTDFNALQILDMKTLEPKRIFTYAAIDPELAGYGICAHPPKDRKRGHIYNYLISDEGVMYIFAMDYASNPAKLVWKTALPCKPCYIHSLAISSDYAIFVRNPVHMDTSDVSKPVSQMLTLETGESTIFYVLDKNTGSIVATYKAAHFFFFHSVNAYDYVDEKSGLKTIHVDLSAYSGDYCSFLDYNFSNLLDPACPFALPRLVRYVWGVLDGGGPAPGSLVPLGKLGNGVDIPCPAFTSGIVKTDWQTGKFLAWRPENGESAPCEPVFVGRPGATDEDDGIVLTIVINRTGTHSTLIALDGKTMREIARAVMPQVLGFGPHGSFIEEPGLYDGMKLY
ncbi:unnamed protein product [Clonostachys rosea]|uniref:Uncharacterized protein n=1 Tax=Bionectria ochroleuca TaxID=29856 RepID=A0ABY6UJ97_BIOOC|nr:unnamed protein product [Clonostachys rosea]